MVGFKSQHCPIPNYYELKSLYPPKRSQQRVGGSVGLCGSGTSSMI